MICEHCNEQEATVHLTQVVDGDVQKLHLCETCATKAGFDLEGPISISDILMGLGPNDDEYSDDLSMPKTQACAQCGMTRQEFKNRGRVGCSNCYVSFEPELNSILKAVQHAESHNGKIPVSLRERLGRTQEIVQLENELQQAVAEERYEEAAAIRDRIRSLRNKKEANV